ncbi:MAG TPA: RNA polymerase sigma factor [Ktedonobacterales bacterium]
MTNAITAPIGSPSRRPVESRAALLGELNSQLAAARPRLTRLARLNGATADQAEDLVQETLLTAWRSLDHLRDASSFDAWLDGICRNVSRRATRRVRHERVWSASLTSSDGVEGGPASFDELPSDTPDPLDELSRQELVALLDSALGHLNVAAREAVSLRYLAEMPSDEAAARLGLTINTLDARLSRARKQLRTALSGPLRERAVEFGLTLAPADEHGWRDSRLWCHFCGQTRMQGILETNEDGTGRMALRCPDCWRTYGIMETNISSARFLAGLTSFKPAMKRLIQATTPPMARGLRQPSLCPMCSSPIRSRVATAADLPRVMFPDPADHYYVVSTCPVCGVCVTSASSLAGLSHPDIKRFILERDRIVLEPDLLVNYANSPAIRFSLHDAGAGERMIFYADPETLDIRHVERA